ncbi:MAG: UDP-N-acetylmuramoyl-L-alanine--D-glutamate ligase [Synechococcaceae cyanobacterium]|nr:UDP-N-acetylmuramoyl-L-alanine--D-glutamate ligase [Synechococcaceae cyanobacterium]
MEAGAPVVVVGLGRSGIGVARLFRAQGHPVTLLESREGAELQERAAALEREGIDVRLGAPLALESLPQPLPAAVVVSPGIAWDHPQLERMRGCGIAVIGEMTPASEATASIPWVAITGTNGKTTVTHLVHHLLSQGGLRAPLCGNVGVSAAEVALACRQGGDPPPDWLVVELSSYQIEQSPAVRPAIGVWTTLTPDHLERHGSVDHYRAIKRRLLENAAVRILNADDADLRSRAASWEKAEWITARPPAELPATIRPSLWIEQGLVTGPQGALFPAAALAMPGDHNRQNLLMATAVALHAGLEPAVIEAGLRRFPGVPHRLERIREHRGVHWFNDSKATNYDAAAVALQALEGPLVVLAGGQAKQGDASVWLEQLRRQAAAVVLYGAARQVFATLLAEGEFRGQVHACEGLAEAVPLAASLAEAQGCCGVLLSPACASFDQYRDFEQRGDHFRELVQGLAG